MTLLIKLSRCMPPLRQSTFMRSLKRTFTSNLDPDPDEIIKFTTSKAAQVEASDAYMLNTQLDRPRFEPIIISLSIAVFLIYFCILREENDYDEMIEKPLYERIPYLEMQTLEAAIKNNVNKDARDIKRMQERLKELKGK